jgi:hypothetical protein
MPGPIPVAVSWLLTAAFSAMSLPPLRRLGKLGQRGTTRIDDTAELLFTVAMVAMVSPIGGPVPAAGWQAMLLLVLGWFTAAWWRAGRRSAYARHSVSSAAMLLMISAMPHDGTVHGPWMTMATAVTPVAEWWTPAFVGIAAWFLVDAVHTGITCRTSVSRAVCRVGMGLGIAYLLVASI